MTTAVQGFPIQTSASGKQPLACGIQITKLSPHPGQVSYTSTVTPAPSFSNLRSEPAVSYPF